MKKKLKYSLIKILSIAALILGLTGITLLIYNIIKEEYWSLLIATIVIAIGFFILYFCYSKKK